MLLVACIGPVKCGFLFLMKRRLSFTVLGTARTLENRTVVLSGQCVSGRSAIL